jgi:Immunity protein Imm1
VLHPGETSPGRFVLAESHTTPPRTSVWLTSSSRARASLPSPELDPDQDTIFFVSRIEEPEVFPNFAVMALADALAAAKEFFASTALPQYVEWFEL